MPLTNRQRLQNVEKRLKQGKLPVLKQYIPGVEQLLEAYKVSPDDVFIPDPKLSDEQNKANRVKFQARRKYKTARLKVGKYTPHEDVEEITSDQRNALREHLGRALHSASIKKQPYQSKRGATDGK